MMARIRDGRKISMFIRSKSRSYPEHNKSRPKRPSNQKMSDIVKLRRAQHLRLLIYKLWVESRMPQHTKASFYGHTLGDRRCCDRRVHFAPSSELRNSGRVKNVPPPSFILFFLPLQLLAVHSRRGLGMVEEKRDCSTSLWVDGKVENTPLHGLVYPVYFAKFVICSRGALPITSIFRATTLDVAAAASAAMRYGLQYTCFLHGQIKLG